jgi:hypothetical protein
MQGPCALIVTSTGKFFSNGNDLQWLQETGQPPTAMAKYLSALLARIATLPIPVVAAVNGHGFAGGCLLAMAADYRVMRSQRGHDLPCIVLVPWLSICHANCVYCKGFLCMNEVDLGGALTPGMNALLCAKLGPLVVRTMLLQGEQ